MMKEIVNIKSNSISIFSGLVEMIIGKCQLSRAGAYCIIQYQRTRVINCSRSITGIQTHSHLVRKRTLNHLAKLAK